MQVEPRETPPAPVPVRLPDAEHERILALEASARAQATTMAAMQEQLDKQANATTSLGAELNDVARKTDAAVTEIKQANVALNSTIQMNQAQLQGSLAAILKKMNLQEERADAPSKKTPRTTPRTCTDGKGSKDDDEI
eukprot:1190490-Pyramimonas_sp.AAC.1